MRELSEKGQQEAIELVERFKGELKAVAEKAISGLYCDLIPHIETDAWTNYREQLRIELQKHYVQQATVSDEGAWAMYVREAIFKQFRAELEQGVIADLTKRIEFLEKLLNDSRRF